MNGADEEVELELPTLCVPCSGTGAEGGVLDTCVECSGRGVLSRMVQMGPFQTRQDRTCPSCDGRGKIPKTTCKACKGRGRKEQSTTLRFSIPAGAEDGTRLRLRGKGEPGRDGQASGIFWWNSRVSPILTSNEAGATSSCHCLSATRTLRSARPSRWTISTGNRLKSVSRRAPRLATHRHSTPRLPTVEGWRSRRCGGAAQAPHALQIPAASPGRARGTP